MSDGNAAATGGFDVFATALEAPQKVWQMGKTFHLNDTCAFVVGLDGVEIRKSFVSIRDNHWCKACGARPRVITKVLARTQPDRDLLATCVVTAKLEGGCSAFAAVIAGLRAYPHATVRADGDAYVIAAVPEAVSKALGLLRTGWASSAFVVSEPVDVVVTPQLLETAGQLWAGAPFASPFRHLAEAVAFAGDVAA